MKKNILRLLVAIICLILIQGLISCESNKTENFLVKTVYVVPDIYFPKFPSPGNNIIIPLDFENKKVTSEDVEIVNCLIPYWYLQLLEQYKVKYDEAISYYNYYKTMINPVVDGINIAGEQ